jgi:hypothetical protein
MKKAFLTLAAVIIFSLTNSTVYAAENVIKIDGVTIASDAKPEIRNDRVMVPVRVISENLGATVEWSNPEVTLSKGGMKIILSLNSNMATKNGEQMRLDSKPYIKNDRVFVPLRFIAETFGSKVNYGSYVVTVETDPLVIDDTPIVALRNEVHMTMGGIVQQVVGNAYIEGIYDLFADNALEEVEAPTHYSWAYTMDILGSYYKNAQFDFLDSKGDTVVRYDVYSLIEQFPEELLEGYPVRLVHDVTQDKWYLFGESARESISNLFQNAEANGFVKVISNTVV